MWLKIADQSTKTPVRSNEPMARKEIWINFLSASWLAQSDIMCARAGSQDAIGGVVGKKTVPTSRLCRRSLQEQAGSEVWIREVWQRAERLFTAQHCSAQRESLRCLLGRPGFFPRSPPAPRKTVFSVCFFFLSALFLFLFLCLFVCVSRAHSGFVMDVLPMCSIFQELQIVHDTGYFSALPSLEEYWQQVKRNAWRKYLKTSSYFL